MGKIKILDKAITNRISAGEVVEKPASIVKELLENSIDAGAKRIIIEIENGGINKIAVTDDGIGIAKEDITLTITPHATSKIENLVDLDDISTLGFRGEALASIASVSRLEIISKTENQELGQRLYSEGGEIKENKEIAAPTGTYIEMSSLFFNTPVRAKFLRNPKTEQADITDYIERIMLAYPNIAFKYIIDGKIKYNTTGGSLEDIIYTIYGKEIVEGLLPVNQTLGDFQIKGYIGKPEISKANRNYQTLLISGRYVKNFMISSAVATAYDSFLMKNKFPFFVLDLILPPTNVDVNVHPNKLEVKFEKPNQIYSAFHKTVLETLIAQDQTRTLSLNEIPANIDNTIESEIQKEEKIILPVLENKEGISYAEKNKEEMAKALDLKSNLSDQTITDDKISFYERSISNKVEFVPIKSQEAEEETQIKEEKLSQTEKQEQQSVFEDKETTIYDVIDYKIVGTMFKTYNIIESGEHVYFIDQHAAHERILYDKYMLELKNSQILEQQLLVPYILQVKDVEAVFLNDYTEVLLASGFQIEEFGYNTFKVSAVPYVFSQIKVGKFFEELLQDFNQYYKHPHDYLKNMIATKACRSAVKAGDNLTDLEIKTIFKTMKQGVLQCPHGRPFVLKLDKLQVEKWFKRVL